MFKSYMKIIADNENNYYKLLAKIFQLFYIDKLIFKHIYL